jgi:hypothetical protein
MKLTIFSSMGQRNPLRSAAMLCAICLVGLFLGGTQMLVFAQDDDGNSQICFRQDSELKCLVRSSAAPSAIEGELTAALTSLFAQDAFQIPAHKTDTSALGEIKVVELTLDGPRLTIFLDVNCISQ